VEIHKFIFYFILKKRKLSFSSFISGSFSFSRLTQLSRVFNQNILIKES